MVDQARSRWGRLVAPAVALFIAGSSVTVAVLAADMSKRQEHQLLTERAGELSAVLSVSISESRSVLQLAATATSAPGGNTTFDTVTAPMTLSGSTIAVVRGNANHFTVVRSTGSSAPQAGTVLDPATATVVDHALHAPGLVSQVFGSGAGKHVVLAISVPTKPARVAFLDSPLSPARQAPTDARSPYRELDVALYAGNGADPSQLVLQSGRLPGSHGPVVHKSLQVGGDAWTLAVSARDPLIGTLATAFPWLLGGFGVLTAAMLGLVIAILVRRREYAMCLVREAELEAERANDAREEFFASVSHDIRTPLTAIMGFTEMISIAEPEQQDEFVQRVRSNVANLGVMVDNMLDHARLHAGALDVVLEPLCLQELVDSCLEDLGPVLTTHKIAVAGEPVMVLADRLAFGRVLANILVNAVRYSPPGTPIEIELSADHLLGRVSVADRGRGIEEDDLETIFDEFARGSRASADGGTGLGLFSVHQLVSVQNGTVGIVSTPGEGTTVTIGLPLAS